MMGRTHALSGAMMFGLAAPVASYVTPLSLAELALGTAVCAGGAVLPDIDHPGSGVSRTFGPLTRGFAVVIGRLSGGHRRGTHSLLGAAAFAVLVFGSTALYAGNGVWLLAGLGAAALLMAIGAAVATTEPRRRSRRPVAGDRRGRRLAVAAVCLVGVTVLGLVVVRWGRVLGTATLAVVIVLALSAVARLTRFARRSPLYAVGNFDDLLPIPLTAALIYWHLDLRVVAPALLLGVLTHIAGDMITYGGCPLGWPWSRALRGPQWFGTNSSTEHGPVWVGCVLVFAATAAWNSGLVAVLTR